MQDLFVSYQNQEWLTFFVILFAFIFFALLFAYSVAFYLILIGKYLLNFWRDLLGVARILDDED